MRKTIIYALVILILGFVAYKSITNSQSTLSKKETGFAIKEPEAIRKIILSGGENEVELIREEETWKFNNLKANQERVQQLVLLSSLLTVQSPVALSNIDEVKKHIEEGVEIRFYNQSRKVHHMHLCTWQNQLYAKLHRSRNLYKVTISSLPNIDLTQLTQPIATHWEDNLLYNFSPDQITSINLSFPTMPSKGFQIMPDSIHNLNLFDSEGNNRTAQTEQELLFQYIQSFEGIRFEVNADKNITPSAEKCFFNLDVQTPEEHYTLAGYLITDMGSGKTNPKVFYGKTSHKGLILLDYTHFDPLLLPIDFFLKK